MLPVSAQDFYNPYLPLEPGRTWNYVSEDFPDTLTSGVVDTMTLKSHLYYQFAPYSLTSNFNTYWLRPGLHKIFALNLQDSTEYVLFDFDAQTNQSWQIPPDSIPLYVPMNQCDWGSKITLFSNNDTSFFSDRTFYNCYLFQHLEHPCYDAGIGNTKLARDYGIIYFSQITEGGVLDWHLAIDPPDTMTLTGTYSVVGNPCMQNPCLPGVVSAIRSMDKDYILSRNDMYFWNGDFSWDGYTPEIGDSIRVQGIITERKDILGDTYVTCEVLSATEFTPSAISRKLSQLHVEEDLLIGNYPNPFNPVTKIEYIIANSGNVKLILFDIQGKMIKTLIDTYQNKGQYGKVLDAQDLPSGIYYYQLQTNGRIQTKSMILVK
jgi:hypothetical protein